MYGAHSNVLDLHASYERAFVKIYRLVPLTGSAVFPSTGSGTVERQAQGPWRDRLRDRRGALGSWGDASTGSATASSGAGGTDSGSAPKSNKDKIV